MKGEQFMSYQQYRIFMEDMPSEPGGNTGGGQGGE
jgi:hypothetical protein